MTVELDFGSGGFDLRMVIPATSAGQWVRITPNSAFLEADKGETDQSGTLEIRRTSTGVQLSTMDKDLNDIEVYEEEMSAVTLNARVVMHNRYISVMINGRWIHTFWLAYVFHEQEISVELTSSGLTVSDLLYTELSDWREAVWIDMEMTAANAIGAVIHQKPIDIFPIYTGEVCFTYEFERDQISASHIHKVSTKYENNTKACSDAIVYHTNVGVSIDEDLLRMRGFVTRMLRLPDLDHGAMVAARGIQERGREKLKMHSIEARLVPHLEMGDICAYETAVSGTGRALSGEFIVESYGISISKEAKVTISGRNNE